MRCCVQSLAYGPLYGNRLANHLPMALLALDRLGADAATMRRFADGYAAASCCPPRCRAANSIRTMSWAAAAIIRAS
jgi:hypothetical protein